MIDTTTMLPVCETYVANVWPVAGVRSQNAVQHIVIRPALTKSRDTMQTEELKKKNELKLYL